MSFASCVNTDLILTLSCQQFVCVIVREIKRELEEFLEVETKNKNEDRDKKKYTGVEEKKTRKKKRKRKRIERNVWLKKIIEIMEK